MHYRLTAQYNLNINSICDKCANRREKPELINILSHNKINLNVHVQHRCQ